MKYFIIAGEASGDLHASNLMKVLRQKDAQALFVGLGGDRMRKEGCKMFVDYREMAYMGFVAVLKNLDKVKRNFRIAKQSLLQEQPDVVVLIDYPSFNLKIAKFCKKHLPQTKVCYYIPPKIWAWKEWRVHAIAKYCDQILGIFPFEPAFYNKYGYKCSYIGNPTADCIREFKANTSSLNDTFPPCKATIAILPGSRPSEIAHCLPVMLNAARKISADSYQTIVVAAPGIDELFYQPYLQNEILTRDSYTVLAKAEVAVVNSGTATLETALIGCPQTAVYHVAGSKYLEWLIKPILFKIKYFTLVNIIPDKAVIQELVGRRFTQSNIEKELAQLLNNEAYRNEMKQQYTTIKNLLGNEAAAENAANIIINR